MSGHSKWSTIKRKKAANDAARAKIWSKLLRFVEVAAREGGGDPDANPTLATAVQKAKAASVPNENIERAIKRGTGELQGEAYEETSYEGYGPGGVAIYVRCFTNNRNRASQEVRSTFNSGGGKLSEPGAVAWMFEPKGVVLVPAASATEEDVFLVAADAGAEDVRGSEESIEVITPTDSLKPVRDALQAAGIEVESSDLTMIPKTTVSLDGGDAKKVLSLIDALEELDDVSEVYANFDISEDVMASLAS
ncbi:MAG TPA: YebC/PmpR family DNA-binding transcriptional regulator [Actinomycetota bacterium]|jgi:YebC/PmpR family DNA-binding regulatory protein|nr:YebC/PmpR family DNA-binding transcriptional regulator [Actinomycetota bacterium]